MPLQACLVSINNITVYTQTFLPAILKSHWFSKFQLLQDGNNFALIACTSTLVRQHCHSKLEGSGIQSQKAWSGRSKAAKHPAGLCRAWAFPLKNSWLCRRRPSRKGLRQHDSLSLLFLLSLSHSPTLTFMSLSLSFSARRIATKGPEALKADLSGTHRPLCKRSRNVSVVSNLCRHTFSW